MTAPANNENIQAQSVPSDKEINFRKQEEAFLRKIEQEKQARLAAEARLQELERASRRVEVEDDEGDDADPYIDRRKLEKKLKSFEEKTSKQTETAIQKAVREALDNERRQNWLKTNSDFHEVMQHAEKLAQKDPELAESILEMPDTFERQKLVYKNIKALRLHEKEQPKSSIQETIDRNRRTPYYQPSDQSAPPYGGVTIGKNYSPNDMKASYDKMQELKRMMRLG